MAFGVECPTTEILAGYSAGILAAEEIERLDAHLSSCPACVEAIARTNESRGDLPQVPGYAVVSEIGRGRFGVVHKGWRMGDAPHRVAIKLLTAVGEMEASRFAREIAVLERIDSPGIVKCIESGVTGGVRFYVMEFVDGAHLDEFLAGSGLSFVDRLAVLERVCRAVSDAHAQGVIHRDLKPKNILIDPRGFPHILDFGICSLDAAVGTKWSHQTITAPGDVIGTLKYMSPEQAWGGVVRRIGKATDIWALGILLYEIVTDGQYPYSTASSSDRPAPEALLERLRKELPRLPKMDTRPRGRDLQILLERCLAYEPDARIESAADLADDLARYGKAERIHTRPLRLVQRARRIAAGAAMRSRWPFTIAFVCAASAAVWIAGMVFDIGWRESVRPLVSTSVSNGTPGSFRPEERLTVVGIFDGTVSHILDFARDADIPGVTADATTWRAVHGAFMQRLAAAQPLAVVWDYYFQTPQPTDDRFAAGLLSLEAAGVPVILPARFYDERGRPGLSPNLIQSLGERLRHGTIHARDQVKRPGEFVLAVQRSTGEVIPGLAMTTLASLLQREARLDVEWTGRSPLLTMLYETQPGAYRRVRDRIETSKVFRPGRSDESVRQDDVLACATYDLHPREFWESRTVEFESLLAAKPEELRTLVGGNLLLIGDLRTEATVSKPDRHPVHSGLFGTTDVPGVYLLADGIAGMLSGTLIRSAKPLPPGLFLLVGLAAVFAALLPIRLARIAALFEQRRTLVRGLVALALSAALISILSRNAAAVHTGMPVFAAAAAMAASFRVEFVRNRHRYWEQSRDDALSVDWPSDGTITLAPKPAKSRST